MSSTSTVAAPLELALRSVLEERLTPGEATYTVDGLVPRFVATPESVEQLATALAAADDHGAAVIPWGGGQHMGLGNTPARYDLALRTTELDRMLEYEPADLTITVEAGMTMSRLQALLAEHGQFLPIDAPGRATVGGVLAAGVSGPSQHAYGLPRDWLLGCRVALADGTLIKGGGRVVKNVAGYDLPKLFVGSLGTLGVIVETTLKLAPLPAAQETLIIRGASVEEAAQLVFAADERGLALRALALRPFGSAQGRQAQGDVAAAFWLAGTLSALERTRRELTEQARGSEIQRPEGKASERWWRELIEQDGAPEGGGTLKAFLLPSRCAEFMEGLLASELASEAIAYPSTGLVLARLAPPSVDEAARAIEEARLRAGDAGGTLVVTAAPVELKQRIDVWGGGDALPLMRRLKEQFDPKRTLSPGRFVGGI